jgi:hypothetical protein
MLRIIRCMRSIFWIGCILTVLVSLLASGAIAESMDNSTVQAPDALDENLNATTEVAPVNETESVIETEPVVEAEVIVSEPVNATIETPVEVVVAKPDLVKDTLVKFVTDARAYALHGKQAALTDFKNPSGIFVNDDMFIFAYDYDGKVLANPFNPGVVGQNQISITDSTGFKYVQQMRDTAKTGFGFVTYQDTNMMNKGAIMEKTSYVVDVDGTYWIGAGVFKSEEAPVEEIIIAPVESPVDVNATMPADVTVQASEIVA